MTHNQKFTIVIPTRNRCATLEYALRTCTAQDDGNLEILVSDNHSQDQTAEVVKAFRDRRIRYVNTGRALGMSENYEFALSQVDSGIVSYIGDDDGYLPGAVADIRALLSATGAKALTWHSASYHWPNCRVDEFRNILKIPLRATCKVIDSRQAIAEVVGLRKGYTSLPCIYHGAAEVAVLKERVKEAGRFFNCITPDVYSGFAIAASLDRYVQSGRPFSVSGASAASIGTAQFIAKPSAETAQIVDTFANENALQFHPRLSYCLSISLIVLDAYLQAQDHIPSLRSGAVDLPDFLKAAAADAAASQPDKHQQIVAAIREIGKKNGLTGEAERIAGSITNRPKPPVRPALGGRVHQKSITLDCAQFAIHDVHAAAVLCRSVIELKRSKAFSITRALRSMISGALGRTP